MTFGGTSAIQAGTTEASLSTVGITPSAPKEHGCNTYSIPGASSLKAIAARGKVLGVLAASQGGSSSVHTAEGVRVGSTAAEVRQAYRGAQLTESYQGLASTNVILATDSAGQAIGFEFEGNSDASNHVDDSSTVRSIRAGTPDLARGFEVCSG
ncbi:hypothetical protein nbrc107696_13070 [Gordonia spumicola]|uniref:Uncharacterized protein n=1 Tax=Gordonia spumicola TaxID=589161 RepID=A0A7I9V715_9ACTN|nr:hypothetical protein nbrc107696_13070 [Gordonia spumicola]